MGVQLRCCLERITGTFRQAYACAAVFVNESVPLPSLGICRLIYLYRVLEEISFRKSHLKFPSIERRNGRQSIWCVLLTTVTG